MENQINQYLNHGSQTEITLSIENIAKSFNKEGFNLIFEILTWLHKNLQLKDSPEIKNKVFRKRTAQEIIESGFVTGCTDWALAFIVFARYKKLPTKYVETIRRRWLDEGNDDNIEGHIFAEVYINNNWYIVDPDQAVIKGWYDRWIVYKKGLDSWDIGIKNFRELKDQFLEFKKSYK